MGERSAQIKAAFSLLFAVVATWGPEIIANSRERLFTLVLRQYSKIESGENAGEGALYGSKLLSSDWQGTLYVCHKNGWLRRGWPNGSWEGWPRTREDELAMTIGGCEGEVLICISFMGLLNATDNVTLFSDEIDGTKHRFGCKRYWFQGEITSLYVANLFKTDHRIHQIIGRDSILLEKCEDPSQEETDLSNLVFMSE